MARIAFYTLFLLGLTGFAGRCFAQRQEFYPFRKYSQNEGLSSYNITKILKDKYGFLWIATQDGLNCFDGNKFTIFNKDLASRRRINGNNVVDMTEDTGRQCIWLATSYGGIQRINTMTQSISPPDTADAENLRFRDKWLHAVSIVGNILWVGTYSGLYAYDLAGHRFLRLHSPSRDPDSMQVGKMICDRAGRVWVGCETLGIFVFSGATGIFAGQLPAPALNSFHASNPLVFWNIAHSGRHSVAFATSWGLRVFSTGGGDGPLQIREQPAPATRNAAFSCAFDDAANIWFSDANGLNRIPSGGAALVKVSENTNANDSWQSGIYSLYADDGHLIWVGSEEGLSCFHPTSRAFAKFYKSYNSAIKIQHAFAVCPLGDSTIYCGATNGLYRINTRNYNIDRIDAAGSCYLVDHITDQELLVSNSQGCYILDDRGPRPAARVYPELRLLRGDLLCCFTRYDDSLVIMGSQLGKGLYVWNTRARRIRLYNPLNSDLSLDNGIVNSVYRDRTGNLWVLSNKSLFRCDPHTGRAKAFHLHLPGSPDIVSVLMDIGEAGGSYWFATYGMGLIQTDTQMHVQRMISLPDGLSNNAVYRIFSIGDSLILATSNDGLSVLNIRTRKIRRYYEPDGLQSNSFEQFCGNRSHDTLYAGGVNGISIIYPRHFLANDVPPKLYYTKIEMQSGAGSSDSTDLGMRTLEIPNDVYRTTIHFSGLNFTNPQRTTYAYRINEAGPGWIDLGDQHFINLIGMNPGQYTVQVKAANEDGLWSHPIQLSLAILPKWYQTDWFKILILLAIGAFFYGLYRYRIAQFHQQQAIRREIANDLHDDLGSTLTTVKVLAQTARRSTEKAGVLDQMEHSLNLASNGLRDLIWVLDDSRDTLRDFIDRVRTFAFPLTSAQALTLDISIEEGMNSHLFTKAEKRNLLMIVKESINNSIKYADCKKIGIQVHLVNKKCCLSITDDGKGFDAAAITDGNGLKNIRYRARQIRYAVDIRSANGKGTMVELMQL